jgi:hypothetical protein
MKDKETKKEIKKQDCIKSWASKYKKEMAQDFLDKCSMGMSLPEIAASWGVLEKTMGEWRDNPKHKEFARAFEHGRTACHAYHTAKLKQLIADGAAGPAINGQITILKSLFPETWNIATRQEVKKEEKAQDPEKINKELIHHLNTPQIKNAMKRMLKDDRVSPLIREVKSDNV